MTRIKICGITNVDDALVAVKLGAHALGFVFADSPRRVTPPAAREIVRSLPPFVAAIGVFVNEQPRAIRQIVQDCHLHAVQLHGNENQRFIIDLSLPAIKAFRVEDTDILTEIESFNVSHFLLDTFDSKATGGTGKVFNWKIARQANALGNVILSGGLHHRNVSEALQTVKPYAVDVSSGVEQHPGRKDYTKLEKFINEVHKWDSRTNEAISDNTAADLFPKR